MYSLTFVLHSLVVRNLIPIDGVSQIIKRKQFLQLQFREASFCVLSHNKSDRLNKLLDVRVEPQK